MAHDWHVEALIQEAQEAARKPIKVQDLKPHERAMLRAIGRIVERDCLSNDEVLRGMKNVLAYLERSIKRQEDGKEGL